MGNGNSSYGSMGPIVAALSVSVIFGFSFMFTANALDVVSPYYLLALRFNLAALVLGILGLFGIVRIRLRGKPIGKLLLLATLQPGLYFLCETNGIRLTSSSEAGLMIALVPVVVAILARIILSERLTLLQVLSILVSISGVFLIVLGGRRVEISGHAAGTALLGGAVISAALYNILSRQLSRVFKPSEITFVMMWFGAVLFTVISLFEYGLNGSLNQLLSDALQGYVWQSALYLGILSSLVAFFALNYALGRMESSRAAVFANLTTVVSVVAGVVFRGEDFRSIHVIGGLLILAGVWGTNHFAGRSKLPGNVAPGRKRRNDLVKQTP